MCPMTVGTTPSKDPASPSTPEHGPRRGQRVQQRRDEVRVWVPGRVRLCRKDVLPQLTHALYVRLDVRTLLGGLRGGEPAHRERFLELGVGAEVLLDRSPDLLCCRGLLEDPEPSVADVDQELQARACIAHLPTSPVSPCHLGAIDQMPQSARLQYYLNLERPDRVVVIVELGFKGDGIKLPTLQGCKA
ncbi:hypothetical protein BJV77DRAFT_681041 [Russula vinacea]|nr:hypothetical protein BJV77DRAFT_681041 [Russula vinacea]